MGIDNMKQHFYISIILIFLASNVLAQNAQETWVNNTYDQMTLDEKVGQLITIRAYAKNDAKDIAKVKSQIKKYKVGGICYFQGTPEKLTELNNTYQSLSKVPLLTSIDGEWGLAMRYKNITSFPRSLMLGAIQNNNLIYEMGKEIGEQCKRVGIAVNFAPVVDVNNNPNNPVINDRSFGEQKYNVIAKSYSYMRGLQDVGVLACAKHFPGHGDTDVDSHLDLPVIYHSRERLDSIEMLPFKALINQGVGSIMVAHLHIPAIDSRPNRPTTLSRAAVTDILRKEMTFNGLIYTDAMEMEGVAKHFPNGEADAEAFNAGADIILLPKDVKAAINAIKNRILNNEIPMAQLEASVKRILKVKYTVGLSKYAKIPTAGIHNFLNRSKSVQIKKQLIENAITLAKDNYNMIPLQNVDNKVATLAFGSKKGLNRFQNRLSKHILHLKAPHKLTDAKRTSLESSLKNKETVIVTLENLKKTSRSNFGLSNPEINFITNLAAQKKVILVVFGSPYALDKFNGLDEVIVSYNDDPMTMELTADAITGVNGFRGRLPVTASYDYKYGDGIHRINAQRLSQLISNPAEVGMDINKLKKIDEIAQKIIKTKAAPGLQVFVAKDNKIVWDKAYGYHTYKKRQKVKIEDIYDVASVTKIAATTLSLMKLYEEGNYHLDTSLDQILPETYGTNKGGLTIRSMLAHHARLKPWIPFYKQTVSDKKKVTYKPLSKYYSKSKTSSFDIPVAKSLYLRSDYRDSLRTLLYESELREKTGYRYSDLGFIMFADVVKNLSGQTLDKFVEDKFYRPLGLYRTTYLPLNRFSKSQIVPSEKDKYFRSQTLQGCVHDMACAMMGGVSGHAGLFSNAHEIGVIMQMLLNGGTYGGRQYLSPETIKLFTTRYHESTRRGLGFDMKELDSSKTLNISEMASNQAFGHLGFTGISALADPKYNLVIIIVANRTYPSMDNRKFIKNNYRPKIQTAVYESFLGKVE